MPLLGQFASVPGHEYPGSGWTAAGIREALEEADPEFPVPAVADRNAWREIRSDELTAPLAEIVLDRARDLQDTSIYRIPASHYLRWRREDGITQPEIRAPLSDRIISLSTLTIAECLEREGRYVDDILDRAWSLCEQTTWAQNAEVLADARAGDGLPRPVDVVPPEAREIPLRTMMVAKTLAELDYVLGDTLHGALRDRIRREVARRLFEPYEARDDFAWMTPPANNWNAAINGGTVIAAMYLLADHDRVAKIVAKACHSLEQYLAGFDAAGCTPEGVDYWSFGVGNYVGAAAQLEARTGGAYSLFTPPVVEAIATFPLRVELSPGRYPPFSDSTQEKELAPYLVAFLGTRYDNAGLNARAHQILERGDPGRFIDHLFRTLRTLAWSTNLPPARQPQSPAAIEYFRGCAWWIARAHPETPHSLTVAAKGGHNDEPHNHLDCGSFVVHASGESILTDLGKPHDGYPPDYWDPVDEGTRYERYINLRSLGHSVPYVNGCEQGAGREFEAEVLGRERTGSTASFTLNLAGCYPPAAGLESLHRTLTLQRGEHATLVVDDRLTFDRSGENNVAESILVSYLPMTETSEGIRVHGDRTVGRVSVDAPVEIERIESPVTPSEVFRARIEMEAREGEASCRLEVSTSRSASRPDST